MKTCLMVAALAVAAVSNAVVVWDNTAAWTSTTFRAPNGAPALHITNTNASAVSLSRVSFSGENTALQNIKFFIADAGGTLLDSVVTSVGVTGAHTLIGADVNWSLGAGQTYYICAMMDTANVNYDYQVPAGTTQNGLVGLVNGNFSGYTNPAFVGDAGAEMSWKLEAVPEPATMAVLGLGVAAMLRRGRRA